MAKIVLSNADYYFKFYGVGENEVYLPSSEVTLEIEPGTKAKLYGLTGGKRIVVDVPSSEASLDNYYSYLVIRDSHGGEVFVPLSKNPVEVFFSDGVSYYAYLDSSGFNLVPADEFTFSNSLEGVPEDVNALLSGYKWDKDVITYSFNEEVPEDYYDFLSTEQIKGWAPFPPEAREAVRKIFTQIENFTNLKFVEVPNDGDIRFSLVNRVGDEAGFAVYPVKGNPIAGDVFISNEYLPSDFVEGKYAYTVLLHEIGHALGLKHPFECCPELSKDKDNSDFTVMTYTDIHCVVPDFYQSGGYVYAEQQLEACRSTYGLYDVAALQLLYGANSDFNKGDTYYDVNDLYGEKRYLTIWDAGGTDTIDASKVGGACFVDLRPGSLSSIDFHSPEEIVQEAVASGALPAGSYGWAVSILKEWEAQKLLYTGENNLAISYSTLIENLLTGSGDDWVVDNLGDNSIFTGGGDDTVFLLGSGYDVVDCGEGYDRVVVGLPRDQVELSDLGNEEFVLESSDGSFYSHLFGVEEVLFDELGEFDFWA